MLGRAVVFIDETSRGAVGDTPFFDKFVEKSRSLPRAIDFA
jgi:hypothetical protein